MVPAFLALAALACFVAANILFFRMIAAINRAEGGKRISYVGMHPGKSARIFESHRTLYPQSAARKATVAMTVVAVGLAFSAFFSLATLTQGG